MVDVLCIGSLNIDLVYRVPHFVRPGETLSAGSLTRGAGGKGLNQSVAAARAGARVRHAGVIGRDGLFLRELLAGEGIDLSALRVSDDPTGHAVIQVNDGGENSIILFPGANHSIGEADIDAAFAGLAPGSLLMLQNEVNGVARLLHAGREHEMRVLLNTAPATPELRDLPIDLASVLVCNETEGEVLTGERESGRILAALRRRCPDTALVLTLGAEGCRHDGPEGSWSIPAERVTPVDTTAAGDTFVGYLAAGLCRGLSLYESARTATRAAALTVTRHGAAESIPRACEPGLR
jgi:ribokinase